VDFVVVVDVVVDSVVVLVGVSEVAVVDVAGF
jgi:hypothetical protein